MGTLWAALESLPDGRTLKGRRYSLVSIVGLSLAAMLSGANDLRAIWRRGRRSTPKGLEMLGIERGRGALPRDLPLRVSLGFGGGPGAGAGRPGGRRRPARPCRHRRQAAAWQPARDEPRRAHASSPPPRGWPAAPAREVSGPIRQTCAAPRRWRRGMAIETRNIAVRPTPSRLDRNWRGATMIMRIERRREFKDRCQAPDHLRDHFLAARGHGCRSPAEPRPRPLAGGEPALPRPRRNLRRGRMPCQNRQCPGRARPFARRKPQPHPKTQAKAQTRPRSLRCKPEGRNQGRHPSMN